MKGSVNMKCPYEQELKTGKIVCDTGYSHTTNIKQCPTGIFNQCQSYTYNRDIIVKTLKENLGCKISELFAYEVAEEILKNIV
jgi:hypothetical protein